MGLSSQRVWIVDVIVKIQDDWKQPSSLSHWPGGFHDCPSILMIDSSRFSNHRPRHQTAADLQWRMMNGVEKQRQDGSITLQEGQETIDIPES